MRRIKAIGLVLVAMFALGAVAAANASAETFPAYLEGLNPPELIKEGLHLPYLALALGSFRLRAKAINVVILCKHVLVTGTFLALGGSTAFTHFLECEVYKLDSDGTELLLPNCTVESLNANKPGLIQLNPVKDQLVFTGSKTEAEKLEGPVGDLFEPEPGQPFVTLVFAGTGCPTGVTLGPTKVEGSVIAKVLTGVLEMNINNTITFVENPPKVGWRPNEENNTTELKAKGLKLFGTIAAEELAEIPGIHLLNEEEWGIETHP